MSSLTHIVVSIGTSLPVVTSLNQPLSASAHFHWRQRAYAIERTGQIVLHRDDLLGATAPDWIWQEVLRQARASQATALGRVGIVDLAQSLKHASSLPSWLVLCATDVSAVSIEIVLDLFLALEMSLLESQSPARAQRVSCAFRGFIGKTAIKVCLDPRFRQLRKFFKSKCSLTRAGRPLLSDIPHASRPILGALPHKNLNDLYKKTSNVLESDLERVRLAALAVVTTYAKSIAELDRICSIDSSGHEQRLIAMSNRYTRAVRYSLNDIYPWSTIDIERYISFRLALNKGLCSKPYVFLNGKVPHFVIEHAKKLVGEDAFGKHFGVWISSREMPAAEVLVACALIIQIKTGWNFSSVLELSSQSIEVSSLPHRLQSIKSRAGDETPLVLIEESDEDVLLALSLLSGRSRYFNEYGLQHSGIWTGRGVSDTGVLQRLTNWGLQNFCKRFNLPLFTPEMLRGQILAVDSINKGSISLAQSRAGHASSKTTFHYINKEILRRLNSANSLEFEKRFDATIRYMIDPKSAKDGQEILSYPIGDGASCAKPHSPPNENWLIHGVCSGQRCHDGDGCQNRHLNIDMHRIEEVYLTKKYYQNNWVRLLNENPAAFERDSLSKMLFAFALFGAISRGPYRHILKELEP